MNIYNDEEKYWFSNGGKMENIFSVKDRQEVFDFVLNLVKKHNKIVSLVQVGSGAFGYNDERSDLDFVIALDTNDSMLEVMEYVSQKIKEKYNVIFFSQQENRHLQCFVLSNLLEIDIGYGGYEYAAAWKPAFKVIFDNSGVVEQKMIKSREWMDDSIYGEKQKKDIDLACEQSWMRLMHAAVAINRGNFFRAVGEIDFVRNLYINLLGNRFKLESKLNREIDKLPEIEKSAIKSTFITGESSEELWRCLLNLTELIYKELEDYDLPVKKEMIYEYYKELKVGLF